MKITNNIHNDIIALVPKGSQVYFDQVNGKISVHLLENITNDEVRSLLYAIDRRIGMSNMTAFYPNVAIYN